MDAEKTKKEFFLKGYNEMLRRIEPERIICYNDPFPEMQGNIVFVDYDLSSWRHMNDDPYVPSKYAKYICGEESWPVGCDIIVKTGHVIRDDVSVKGMGSAYGGEWKPAKKDDERFLGKPGAVNKSRAGGKRGGYDRETKIGEEGKASKERHYTDHDNPTKHSDPHDHKIDWSNGFPKLSPPINYPNGNVPEFKSFKEMKFMSEIIGINSLEENRFKTISDFKWCLNRGGEIEFEYKERVFGIFPLQKRNPESEYQILICEKFVDDQKETEKWYDTADEVLEYMIDGVRLRDVITEVIVWDRTI